MEEKECGPEGDFLQAPHMNLQKHCALFDNSRKPAILPLWLPSCLLSLCLLLPLFYIATNPSIVFPSFPSDPNSFTGLQNFHEIWSPASSHLRSIQPVIELTNEECWRISNKIFSFSTETFSESQSVAENQEDPSCYPALCPNFQQTSHWYKTDWFKRTSKKSILEKKHQKYKICMAHIAWSHCIQTMTHEGSAADLMTIFLLLRTSRNSYRVGSLPEDSTNP